MSDAPVVLGVNRTQDASICLMHGSQVVYAIQKERLTRQKHHWGKLDDFRKTYISHLPDLNKPIDVLVECYSSDSEIKNLSAYEQELAETLNFAPELSACAHLAPSLTCLQRIPPFAIRRRGSDDHRRPGQPGF